MSLLFEKQNPKDLWQDFGCIKDSSIESTIHDIEREIEKRQNQITNSTQMVEIPFRFSFQGQIYRIKYFPKENFNFNGDYHSLLPFLLSTDIEKMDSTYNKIRLLFGIEESFLVFYSDDNGKIDDKKCLNLNRILQTLFLFKNFPLFVRLSSKNGFSSYIGSINLKPQIHYTFNSRIENREESMLTRLNDIVYVLESNKPSLKGKLNFTFSVRDIYHFQIPENLNFIICSEWPTETNRLLKLDFGSAKRYIISIYPNNDTDSKSSESQENHNVQNKFAIAFSFAENHEPKFKAESKIDVDQLENDLFSENEITEMKVNVKYIPSSTVLTFIAEQLTFSAERDQLWLSFLRYVRKCIEKRREIQCVGLDSVKHSDCLIYQKLVLINIAIHKIKLAEKTSNYSLTSDMIEEADSKIRTECTEIDSTLTESQIIKLRKEIFTKKATNQSLQSYLNTKSGKHKEICTAAWKVIPQSWFDPQFLCEYSIDYLETLEPHEVLKPLIFILLLERCNDFYDPEIEIANQIEIYLNNLKFELDILNIHEFVQRCAAIEEMIEELVRLKSFKNYFNFTDSFLNCQSIINSLFEKKTIIIDKKDEKRAISNYFHELKVNDKYFKHENQFIVSSSLKDSRMNFEQRTFVLNDLTNSKVIVASATKEEFLY